MLKSKCKKQKVGNKKMVNQLKERKFDNSTELVKFLNKHFTWKADKDTESIYIIDKSNPDRNRSREYKIAENKDKKLYLSEV